MGAFLVALLAVTIFTPFPETYSAFQNDVAVRGTVANWYNRDPLPGAVVYAYSIGSGVTQATTNRHGDFFFLTLLPGFYGFDAVRSGYDYACPFEQSQEAVELSAGFQYSVNILLGPAMTRNGYLMRCLGPHAQATVGAQPGSSGHRRRNILAPRSTTMTVSERTGHVSDTVRNRALIENTTNNPSNGIGWDGYA